MNVYVIGLLLDLSLTHLSSNMAANMEYFVQENDVYSTPHYTVRDIKRSVVCPTICSMNPYCCGYTVETSTSNCLLFHYQTSNNCQNNTGGGIKIHYVKQLTDCSELPPDNPSGVFRVYLLRQTSVLVYCEMADAGGGWTVLQRRQDGGEDFYRSWADYKRGFGDMENEFWIGNDIIHNITSQKQYKVRFDLEGFDGLTAYAEYTTFYVDSEAMKYGMIISGYSGNAGEVYGLAHAETDIVPFSTRDIDNDRGTSFSCADSRKCGWWFVGCGKANINGMFKPGVSDFTTIHWINWKNRECLRKTRMMIRPA